MKKKNIEVIFSPELFPLYEHEGKNVVVVDILRATTVITTMFHNGVEKVIPVKDVDQAKAYKKNGFLVVAERNGAKLDFADFGNSPSYFTPEVVNGKTLVYSTTNGTHAISMGKNAKDVIIGSFLNFTPVLEFLKNDQSDVLIICAGWKGKFNIEDSIYAGALAQKLMQADFETICDSTNAAIELWKNAAPDLNSFIDKAAQRWRLKKMGLDFVIPYCLTMDESKVLPILQDNYLVNKAEDSF